MTYVKGFHHLIISPPSRGLEDYCFIFTTWGCFLNIPVLQAPVGGNFRLPKDYKPEELEKIKKLMTVIKLEVRSLVI